MTYISRRQLEAFGEPIGDMSRRGADNRAMYYGGGKDEPEAPDYAPVAEASKESAQIMAALGEKQLAQAQSQYDQNMAVSKPIVDAQASLMKQSIAQGDDYYNYSKSTYRPIEEGLAMDAMGLNADEMAQVYGLQSQEQQAYKTAMDNARTQYQQYMQDNTKGFDTSGFTDIAVPTAQVDYDGDGVADAAAPTSSIFGSGQPSTSGRWVDNGDGGPQWVQTNTPYTPKTLNQKDIDAAELQNRINAQMRTSLGTLQQSPDMSFDDWAAGISADSTGSTALMQKLSAGALDRNAENKANTAMADARQGTTAMQNQLARQGMRYGWSPKKLASMAGSAANTQGLGLASAANTAREQEKNLQYAKKMDVAGLGKGLAGASTGAYSVANQSGNSAVQNQMAPGAQYQNGMAQGANTIGAGLNTQMNGLNSILGAQTSIYNNSGDDGFGSLLSGVGSVASIFGRSSKEIKENKEPIGEGSLESLRKLNVEKWKYKDGVEDEGEHIGPYAEDVQEEFGDEAAPGGKVLDMMSMNGILIKSVQELADKVDALQGKTGGAKVALPRKKVEPKQQRGRA